MKLPINMLNGVGKNGLGLGNRKSLSRELIQLPVWS